MVIALSKLEKPTLIEFMSRVPEDAGLSNTSLLVNGRYPSDGPVLANVPGTTAGMHAAWKKYGTAKTVKPGTLILHSRADDVIPFADSEELVRNSGLPATALIEVGNDHRLADPESLGKM